MTTVEKMLTVKEAAELSGYSEWMIRKFCRQGVLRSRRRKTGVRTVKNTRILIPESALDNFLTDNAA